MGNNSEKTIKEKMKQIKSLRKQVKQLSQAIKEAKEQGEDTHALEKVRQHLAYKILMFNVFK